MLIVEIVILFVLILFNGFMAMSELAVVSARPARLKSRADQGQRGAARAPRDGAQHGGRAGRMDRQRYRRGLH